MYSLTHLGLSLAAVGRYAEATEAFHEARSFGRKYGAIPMLARATAMAAGLHLTLLTFARLHEPGRAERLLEETAAAAASTAGWHQWLWQLRLTQARAELALARNSFAEAIARATDGVEQSRARGRPKYEALGLITRARGLHAVARTRNAIGDTKTAVRVADRTGDPVLLLLALDALIGLDGTDELATRARAVTDCICDSLPNEAMRRCFTESEVMRSNRAPQ